VTTIQLSAPELIDLPLEPEVFLGGGPQSADSHRRASVGRPEVRQIGVSEVSDDPDLVAFVEQSTSTFFLVSLVCGFAAGEHDRIESARVGVDLESEGDEAIAWSLSPVRLVHPVKPVSLQAGVAVKLGPFLSIHGDWAAPDEVDKCFVYAVGEREPDPEWRYKRTASESLNGLQHMAMVVEAAPQTVARGSISVEARLTHRNALIRTKVTMPPDVESFELAAG
jgi:hypothetical protein